VNHSEDTRSNNRQGNGRMDKKQEYKRESKTSTTSTGKENKDAGKITTTRNASSEGHANDKSKRTQTSNKNGKQNGTGNNDDKNSNNTNNKGQERDNKTNNNNEGGNKIRVNILEPEDTNTYAFTVSWRPEQKKGQDGKIIIK
jgi:hypothetical protein